MCNLSLSLRPITNISNKVAEYGCHVLKLDGYVHVTIPNLGSLFVDMYVRLSNELLSSTSADKRNIHYMLQQGGSEHWRKMVASSA